jgi:hypothetical protein
VCRSKYAVVIAIVFMFVGLIAEGRKPAYAVDSAYVPCQIDQGCQNIAWLPFGSTTASTQGWNYNTNSWITRNYIAYCPSTAGCDGVLTTYGITNVAWEVMYVYGAGYFYYHPAWCIGGFSAATRQASANELPRPVPQSRDGSNRPVVQFTEVR